MVSKGEVQENDNMVTIGWILWLRNGNELGKSDSGSN